MFEFMKKSLEDYKQEKEAPFNYNGLMSKLSNYRAETYLEISNKLEELYNTLDESDIEKLQGTHKVGLPCGDVTYHITFNNSKYTFNDESLFNFELKSTDKNEGIFLIFSDFPKDFKTCIDKINKLSEECLILLDNISSNINILFNEIDKGIAEDIQIEINKIKEPKNELLNILKKKYNDNEYEDNYDYDDR